MAGTREIGMWLALAAAGAAPLTGCASQGPHAIEGDRSAYIDALAMTDKEELLSNIVRVKYTEPPVFLKVSSIAASVSAEAALGAGLGFGDMDTATTGSVTSGLAVERNPTVFYAPLSGDRFANNLLVPFDLVTVFLMLANGFEFEVVAELAVTSINGLSNARNASPAARAEFRAVVGAIGSEIRAGRLRVGTRAAEFDAATLQVVLRRIGEGAASPALRDAYSRLGIDPDADEVALVIGLGGKPKTLAIQTRSLLSVLSYLSNHVEPPEAHREIVWPSFSEPGEPGPIRITASRSRPTGPGVTAVRYQGYWFAIAGEDLKSQNTLYLLRLLFNLQAQAGLDARQQLQIALPLN